MAHIVPFRSTRRRRRSQNFKRKSSSFNNNSRPSSRNAKFETVGAANVFQMLAIENRSGLAMLENLARQMLVATRKLATAASAE